MSKEKIQQIIDDGIAFLAGQQQKEGYFMSLSFAHANERFGAKRYHSLFFTPLILDALQAVPQTPQVTKVRKKAAAFLLTQKSEKWSFNYWIRDSEEAKLMPYPDDLDDTFCSLASLSRYNHAIIDGKVMAEVVQVLTSVEMQEGGPYRTWLVPQTSNKKWKDTDIAVNSNIAYFLSLHGVELPRLTSFIEKHIKGEKFESQYYPSIYPVIYFISRFYKGQFLEKLKDILLSKRSDDGVWENPLYTALAVSSLFNFGVSPDKLETSVSYLIHSQKENWQPYAFCMDPMIDGTVHYAGSSALTTAFCLEAIAAYQQSQEQRAFIRIGAKEEMIYAKVIKQVEDVFSLFEKEFRSKAASLLSKLVNRKEGRQIPLMPYYFAQTLGKKSKEVDDDLLIQLGAANVLGWIAYTIYDDFLDDEGDPAMLSIANVAHRELTSIFDSLFVVNNGFRAFYRTVMDRLDEANTWEVSKCRVAIVNGAFDGKQFKLPRYGELERLACKSLGHGLGPIAILFALGYAWDSTEVKLMVNFFEHYLIAKQLNDDAHDWEDDLKNGHINPVVSRLLRKVYPAHIKSQKEVAIDALLPTLQKLFWNEVIVDVCRLIFAHTKKARVILQQCEIIENPGYLEEILVVYEHAAHRVLHEREQSLQFVEAYEGI